MQFNKNQARKIQAAGLLSGGQKKTSGDLSVSGDLCNSILDPRNSGMVFQGYLSINDIRMINRVKIGIDLKACNKNYVLAAVRQNGLALQYASEELRGDIEVTMAAMINNSGAGKFSSIEDQDKRKIEGLISKSERELQTLCNNSNQFTTLFCVVKNGRLLQHASDGLKNDREVVLAAVRQDGSALEYASEELKGNREVVLEAVKQDGYALEHASEELKGDREVVLEAVKRDGYSLQHASAELKGDREVVLEAVKQDGRALEHASAELKGNRDFILAAVRQNRFVLRYRAELSHNRDFMLDAVRQDGLALEYASEELKGDRGVMVAALCQNIHAKIWFDSDKLVDLAGIIKFVETGDFDLNNASEELKGDREVVLEAVKRDGCALQYASEELKGDREVVLEAVKRDWRALEYASEELKGDREVVLEAVKQYLQEVFRKFLSNIFFYNSPQVDPDIFFYNSPQVDPEKTYL